MLSALAICALVAVCTGAALLSIAAVFRVTAARWPASAPAGPLSVLKPLCGADESLEANLETFFAQRHPDFELVFGVERADDPAVNVVRHLLARHPEVRARLVIHGRRGLNPKVANLRGILAAGAHDLVVISDSNVAVGPDHLARLSACFAAAGGPGREAGLVTSLVAGTGARTLGAMLECLALNGGVAGGIATSELISGGRALVVGKALLFRRSLFEELGGMESLASVLAEDYLMGRMFAEAGHPVRVCADVVRNVSVQTSVRTFLARQLRWALLRTRLKPLAWPFELLLNPSAVALLGLLLGAGPWVLGWALGLSALRDGLQWWRLRGPAGIAAVVLGPVRDLLMIGVWAAAPFQRTVGWRGHRLRVSAGTRVYADGAL